MEIIRSRVMGFCAGVQSAIVKVNEAIELGQEKDLPVYTIGPLIHNEQYLSYLESRGVQIVGDPEERTPGIAVIRAHGIPRKIREQFESAGYHLLDGTCPRVLRNMRIVREKTGAGELVVLVGDAGHGEVTAVAGAADDPSQVEIIHNIDELERVVIDRPVTLLSQTTFSKERFNNIAKRLLELTETAGRPLEVVKSICPATKNRQDALLELCGKVDAIIVIGGKTSSNTKRLYELARDCSPHVWHINSAEEVSVEMCGYDRIGVTAGASTPDWLIETIEERIREQA